MQKIILYARESTKWQVQNGFGIESQVKMGTGYVQMFYKDYELEVLKDEGASARSMKRPIFSNIINRIKQKDFDVLVVYTYDRLTRSLKDFIELLALMNKQNIILDSIREQFKTNTPTGKFISQFIVSLAQWESDTIAERTNRGLDESVKQGNFCKGYTPFGYTKMKDGKRSWLEINEDEAEVVKWIYDQMNLNHRTVNQIYQELRRNKSGNKDWRSKTTVLKLIQSPIYYGAFEHKGELIEDYLPAIISKEEFEKANRSRARKYKERRYEYLYKGYCYCSVCQRQLTCYCSPSKNDRSKVYKYYRCCECHSMINEDCITEEIDNKLYSELNEKSLINFKKSYFELSKKQRQNIIKDSISTIVVDLPKKTIIFA